jgi:hypothetical protein
VFFEELIEQRRVHRDLITFFPAGSSWDLDSMFAVAVNNRGEIVGSGLFNDRTVHNFVLIRVHGH